MGGGGVEGLFFSNSFSTLKNETYLDETVFTV